MEVTLEELLAEIEEKSKDLEAFTKARELIRNRVLEVSDSKSRLTPLPSWSGTDAVLGSLDLSIHAIERTLVELNACRKTVEATRPLLRLVGSNEEE